MIRFLKRRRGDESWSSSARWKWTASPCNVAQEGTGTNCTFSEVAASGAVVFWELYRTVYLAVWTVGSMDGDEMTFDQSEFDVRCEWGLNGVANLAPISDAIIIVDVMSFSTAVVVGTARGAYVHPYRWKDDSSIEFADSIGGELAGSRGKSKYSLSPVANLLGLMSHPTRFSPCVAISEWSDLVPFDWRHPNIRRVSQELQGRCRSRVPLRKEGRSCTCWRTLAE